MEQTFKVGDTIKVHQKIYEAGKERTQIFEGLVIAIRGRGENKMFTVRKIGAQGIGVERIWPLVSPHIAKIVVKSKGNVRRAKLYYLREKQGKELAQREQNEQSKPSQAGGGESKKVSPK